MDRNRDFRQPEGMGPDNREEEHRKNPALNSVRRPEPKKKPEPRPEEREAEMPPKPPKKKPGVLSNLIKPKKPPEPPREGWNEPERRPQEPPVNEFERDGAGRVENGRGKDEPRPDDMHNNSSHRF